MTDLVEQLRGAAEYHPFGDVSLYFAAANRIEELEKKLVHLEWRINGEQRFDPDKG